MALLHMFFFKPNQLRVFQNLFTASLTEPLSILGLGVVYVFCGHDLSLSEKTDAQVAL